MSAELELQGAEREIEHLAAEVARLKKALIEIRDYADTERHATLWTVVRDWAARAIRG